MKHNVTRLNWIVQFILIYLYESYQFEITIRLMKSEKETNEAFKNGFLGERSCI